MRSANPTCPLSHQEVVDLYFLEHRAKVLDIAAFLDRVDRATGQPRQDYRLAALRQAIQILLQPRPGRARRVLETLSDPTPDPIPQAPGKGAAGAPQPRKALPRHTPARKLRRPVSSSLKSEIKNLKPSVRGGVR